MNRRVVMGLVLLLLVPGLALGQELTGGITGTVKDQQGLVIPGANVTARHVETNIVYRATTTGLGRFVIPKVRLGNYTLTVESQGFRRAVVTGVRAEVGGVANVSIALQLGEVTQEVTVSADVSQELLNTTDAELGTVVDTRRVLELPLNGRNATELTFLQAGAYYEVNSDGTGNKLFVHGQRHRALAITLDGVDTQDNLNRASSIMVNQPLIALAAENVQEFRVVTGIASAEFTRGGAHVSAVTRSGSNEFHGSLFEFHRNTVFNANDFFNNLNGVERNKLIRNQFGGRIGGPIWKDKLFFFFGYQQTRESRGIPVSRTVWTAEARQGIYRWNEVDSAGNVIGVNSVNLLACDAVNYPAAFGDECFYPFNPRGRFTTGFTAANPPTIDPFIAANIIANMPMPNAAGGDGLNTAGFQFNAKSLTFEHLPSARIDYRITDKHLFYGTFNYVDRNIDGDFINGREPVWPTLEALGFRVTHARTFSGAVLSNLTSNIVNEARVGWVGGRNSFIRNQPFDTPEFTLDLLDISDPYEPGGGNSDRDNVTLHVRDTVSWIRGNHQFKFGGEWRHRSVENFSFFETAPLGEIDFDNSPADPNWSTTDLRTLARLQNPTATINTRPSSAERSNAEEMFNSLVGIIDQVEMTYNVNTLDTTAFGPPGTPQIRKFVDREFDWFFNDTWNIHPRLTLNLGLRWEWQGVPYETKDLSLVPEGGQDAVFGVSGRDGFFNPGVLAGQPCADLAAVPTASPTTAQATALILNCSVKLIPGGGANTPKLYDNDFNNFAPVVGVAWDPFGDGKTSVRGGYRISYLQDVFSVILSNVDDNEGLQVDQDCDQALGTCQNNIVFLRDIVDASGNIVLTGAPPVAPIPPFSLPATRTLFDSDAQDFRTYQRNLGTAYYQEWTFGIQREIFRNWALDVRYVGGRGSDLRRVADFNELNVNAFDSNTGMSFLDSFLLAQQNLVCNDMNGVSDDFSTMSFPCSVANPLMDVLLQADPGQLFDDSDMVRALEINATGDFLDELLQDTTSRPAPGESRIRGGAFWGAVLRGDLPLNFFSANPFIASSRRMVNDGFSTYHALEIEVRRRAVGGFSFQGSYTFQRAIADYDGDSNTLLNDVRPSSVINPRATIQEFMPRHQVNVNWIYELPVGRGKRWSPSGFAEKILGGWQFGGIINFRSGRPDTIFTGIGTFHRTAVSGANTVNLSQNMQINELGDKRTIVNSSTGEAGIYWFDPCLSSEVVGSLTGGACSDSSSTQGLFLFPNPGELGQLSQTSYFGPKRFVFDFNMVKTFPVTETVETEFRWEVFNAFNNVNFGLPSTSIFSSNFGRISGTITNPRLMQFALKVNF